MAADGVAPRSEPCSGLATVAMQTENVHLSAPPLVRLNPPRRLRFVAKYANDTSLASSSTFRLTSTSMERIVFRVQTTLPKLFRIVPPSGTLEPYGIVDIDVSISTKTASVTAALNSAQHGKFRVQAAVASTEASQYSLWTYAQTHTLGVAAIGPHTAEAGSPSISANTLGEATSWQEKHECAEDQLHAAVTRRKECAHESRSWQEECVHVQHELQSTVAKHDNDAHSQHALGGRHDDNLRHQEDMQAALSLRKELEHAQRDVGMAEAKHEEAGEHFQHELHAAIRWRDEFTFAEAELRTAREQLAASGQAALEEAREHFQQEGLAAKSWRDECALAETGLRDARTLLAATGQAVIEAQNESIVLCAQRMEIESELQAIVKGADASVKDAADAKKTATAWREEYAEAVDVLQDARTTFEVSARALASTQREGRILREEKMCSQASVRTLCEIVQSVLRLEQEGKRCAVRAPYEDFPYEEQARSLTSPDALDTTDIAAAGALDQLESIASTREARSLLMEEMAEALGAAKVAFAASLDSDYTYVCDGDISASSELQDPSASPGGSIATNDNVRYEPITYIEEEGGCLYEVAFDQLPVCRSESRKSKVLCTLAKGMVIRVLEVSEQVDEGRIRARTAAIRHEPGGWISQPGGWVSLAKHGNAFAVPYLRPTRSNVTSPTSRTMSPSSRTPSRTSRTSPTKAELEAEGVRIANAVLRQAWTAMGTSPTSISEC